MYSSDIDTIAAIATPPGLGGIAVLRISGPGALALLSGVFVPAVKPSETFSFRPRYMHYGRILDAHGAILDTVLAVYMPGPHSFTGEDVGEIHCHGGSGVSAALLESLLESGARLARPGEFTRRAYMNGRLDLAQAEAVAELIHAPGREGARLAAAKLAGALSRQVRGIRESLDAMRVQVILAVDFPDEEAELLSRAAFAATVRKAYESIEALLRGFERARLWREGALAVLAGRVNAGKSSLLNALLGRERAIVSALPGTTRDYIEESVNLQGLPLRLVDTAGLRQGGDLVEEEGIRRSRDLAEEADVLIFVIDVGQPPQPEDLDFLRRHAQKIQRGNFLIALNKMDLCPLEGETYARELLRNAGIEKDCPAFAVAAREGLGIDALALGLRTMLTGWGSTQTLHEGEGGDIAPNLRQSLLLRQTLPELQALETALHEELPPDILGVHLEAAMLLLDEVCGTTGNEALLDRIFSDFCIGK